MKARQCNECTYFVSHEKDPCTLGNKPRFYKPKNDDPYADFGYKKKCEDFKINNAILEEAAKTMGAEIEDQVIVVFKCENK